jgi:DNA-binding beta-propeller fold protein YncE/mono/diheme cytochrome c family protein
MWRRNAALLIVTGLAAACGGAAQQAPRSPDAPVAAGGSAAVASGAACHDLTGGVARGVAGADASSTIVLATVGGRSVAYVSDEDVHAILTVDVESKKQLASTPVDGMPGHMLMTRDGRLLLLMRDKAKVAAFTPGPADKPLSQACAAPTAEEPFAMALTPDGKSLLVTSAWGRSLAVLDAGTFQKKKDIALPREPRAVIVGDDGKTAFVSHAVGSHMSVVDLSAGTAKELTMRGKDPLMAMQRRVSRFNPKRLKAAGMKVTPEMQQRFAEMEKEEEAKAEETGRISCQGYALAKTTDPKGRVLAPQVFVDAGDPNQRAEGYGDDDSPTEAPSVAVIDDATGTALDTSLAFERERMFMGGGDDPRDHHEPCLLPRAAAIDPNGKSLLVTCFGIDDVVEYDAAAASPVRAEKRRWGVGAGPTGIAVDATTKRAVVWSQFDRIVNVIDLGAPQMSSPKSNPREKSARIELPNAEKKITPEVAMGRLLFHAAGDNRIAKDGRACASCHPDGRDDAITWATPDGPRRSILLAGRVGQAPYSWSNPEHTLREHLATTFDRLDGAGLRSLELDAIVAYITTMAPPNAAAARAPANAKVVRGREIFNSKESQCATCHSPDTNFADGMQHDVKSKATADRKGDFNTPSLRGVGGAGPWFHDGRYKTLGALLRGVDGKMGKTSHLKDDDLDALESYLRTL